MKYLTYVKRITEALKTYKAEIDILEKKYVEKKKEIKDKASEMSGKWTDEYIESFIEENNPDINFKASFQNARDKVEPMSRAAIAAGCDGLIIEVHHCPDCAMCDGAQSLYPHQLKELLEQIKLIADVCAKSTSF